MLHNGGVDVAAVGSKRKLRDHIQAIHQKQGK